MTLKLLQIMFDQPLAKVGNIVFLPYLTLQVGLVLCNSLLFDSIELLA